MIPRAGIAYFDLTGRHAQPWALYLRRAEAVRRRARWRIRLPADWPLALAAGTLIATAWALALLALGGLAL